MIESVYDLVTCGHMIAGIASCQISIEPFIKALALHLRPQPFIKAWVSYSVYMIQ